MLLSFTSPNEEQKHEKQQTIESRTLHTKLSTINSQTSKKDLTEHCDKTRRYCKIMKHTHPEEGLPANAGTDVAMKKITTVVVLTSHCERLSEP